nr:MAG TPA: Mesencephalic astrocyte-derived neurotrophic factor bond, Glycoprotein, Growth factor [Bacteriophage sp.]
MIKKPQERNLSGIYTRIKRDGKYQTIDITDMTPEELAEYLDKWGMDCNFLQRLVQNLVETVQRIADKFDIEVDEEE